MKRVGFQFKVRQDRLTEYKEHHKHVWPEMLDALRETGWHNYTLFMREDGLIAIGSHVVVIASDTPGTVREVFQAAEQDSYWVGDRRSPMVLLEAQAASAFELLMRYARRDGYADLVKSFADPREAVDFIVRTPPLRRPSPAPTTFGAGVRRMRYRHPS